MVYPTIFRDLVRDFGACPPIQLPILGFTRHYVGFTGLFFEFTRLILFFTRLLSGLLAEICILSPTYFFCLSKKAKKPGGQPGSGKFHIKLLSSSSFCFFDKHCFP